MQREREKIRISSLKRDVFMNFITLADEAWMGDNWTVEEMGSYMEVNTLNSDFLLAMLWRLMDDESKQAVANVEIFQWDGVTSKTKMEFTSPVAKLKHIVSGAVEIFDIYKALLMTRVKSMPEPRKNEEKKSPEEKSSVTPSSTRPLPMSTDGLAPKYRPTPSESFPE